MMMLYNLIQIKGGEETVFMIGELPKVRDRQKQLRQSQRGKKITYVIRPAEEGDEKYRKPPSMNFCPSGDADTRGYRDRKAKAKRIKKRNPK
jgi:hypothetical protein